jgi:hypothetical protein
VVEHAEPPHRQLANLHLAEHNLCNCEAANGKTPDHQRPDREHSQRKSAQGHGAKRNRGRGGMIDILSHCAIRLFAKPLFLGIRA